MYEAVFRNIDDTLRKDTGCSSELDYVEQTSWILFLKYLDDFDTERETAAELDGSSYRRIIDGEYRWSRWASPKKADGSLDHNVAMTGANRVNFFTSFNKRIKISVFRVYLCSVLMLQNGQRYFFKS